MKVIVPLQTCSTRVKHKNIRPFHGSKSLFDIKAEQILRFEKPENVYVSSENEVVDELCRRYGFHFLLRDPALTGNDVYQPDLITALTDPIPGDDDIAWIQVTSPLFNDFERAVEEWTRVRSEHDSLVAVKRFKGHLLDDRARPVNYAFGYWHTVSQKLAPLYSVLWSLFILKRETVRKFQYHIGVTPYLFTTDAVVVDIDYEEDFELAQIIYQRLAGSTNGTNRRAYPIAV
jgi:CMP-N-acetylneuraminic acid synthetase